MATGRTLNRWAKVYGNGYDLSGYARSIGELPFGFESSDVSVIADPVSNSMINKAEGREVNINCILDSALVPIAAAGGTYWDLMVVLGMRAAPVAGDPVYMGKFALTQNMAGEDGGAITAALKFQGLDASDPQHYKQPWGKFVAPWADYSAANAAVGYDDLGAAGPTAYGGYFMYQIFAFTTNGTVTISLDDSTTNADDASFAPMAGGTATTAAIAQTAIPCAGIIELAQDASVRRYVRWQIALAGMTHVWMSVAFVRGTVGLS